MNRSERLRSEEGVQQEALLKTRKQEFETLKREVRSFPLMSDSPIRSFGFVPTAHPHQNTPSYIMHSLRPASSTTRRARGTSGAA